MDAVVFESNDVQSVPPMYDLSCQRRVSILLTFELRSYVLEKGRASVMPAGNTANLLRKISVRETVPRYESVHWITQYARNNDVSRCTKPINRFLTS